MSISNALSRRGFLRGSQALLATAVMAQPALVWASAPGERRLVVLVLRGGLDGIDLLRPFEDPNWRRLRPTLSADAGKRPLELAPGFALHPALRPLRPLWKSGDLAFAQAVATPYRDKRSHFEGQDILEMGTATSSEVEDGWLNRALMLLPRGQDKGYAVAVASERMLLLRGEAPALFWSARNNLKADAEGESLLDALYGDDPLFAKAFEAAQTADVVTDELRAKLASRRVTPKASAQLAAEMLRGEARIVGMSLGGWDTHAAQAANLKRRLKQLSDALLALREQLGAEIWANTTVMTVSEFGRTVAENGTRGTDHGTAGVTLLAGGGIRGGRIYGDWPGLGEGDLYQGRDLMPTQDLRLYPAHALRAGFGLSTGAIERSIFPGLNMSDDPGFL
ncbi:MAG: DUF1501 domain-containing protein [Kiloniellales bacterium]